MMFVMEVAKIGSYLRERRALLGKTQQQIADAAETSAAYISQIEGGRVGLPNPDLRRRLAKALGVSHLDILIASGEITEDEVFGSGVRKLPELDPRRQRIIDLFLALPVHDRYLTSLESTLTTFLAFDPNTGQKVDDIPEHRHGVRVSGAE